MLRWSVDAASCAFFAAGKRSLLRVLTNTCWNLRHRQRKRRQEVATFRGAAPGEFYPYILYPHPNNVKDLDRKYLDEHLVNDLSRRRGHDCQRQAEDRESAASEEQPGSDIPPTRNRYSRHTHFRRHAPCCALR